MDVLVCQKALVHGSTPQNMMRPGSIRQRIALQRRAGCRLVRPGTVLQGKWFFYKGRIDV